MQLVKKGKKNRAGHTGPLFRTLPKQKTFVFSLMLNFLDLRDAVKNVLAEFFLNGQGGYPPPTP